MLSRNTNGGNIPDVITPVRVLAALLLALSCAAPGVLAATPAESVTSRIIVQWRSAASVPGAADTAATPARLAALRTRTLRRLEHGWNIGGSLSVLQLEQPQTGAELTATLAALREDPDVEYAVPDAWVKAHAYTPNDPLYATGQWYLRSNQISAIRASDAWDITRGGTAEASNVVVAVLDSGVRTNHPDLAGKLVPGWDFISTSIVSNDGDGWDSDPTDTGDYMTAEDLASPPFAGRECGGGPGLDEPITSSWHGTRVSGLIAAASDNNVGIAGAGFHVRVLPVRVLGKCGGYESDVIAGMYWAAGLAPPPPYLNTPIPPVNTNPARIINMSLGREIACSSDEAAPYRTAVRQLTEQGVLIVASTGNSGAAVGTPASCPGVLAVAGLRHAGTKVGYSNLGPEVGIAAPAGNCFLLPTAQNPNPPCVFALNTLTNLGATEPANDGYSTTTMQPTLGTSFSTPLAAGTAALMLSVNPGLSPAQIISLIRSSARPFPTSSDTNPQPPQCVSPTQQAVQNTECICNTQFCGAGMLNAHAAVLAAQGATPDPPQAPSGGGGSSGSLLLPALLLGLARIRRRLMSPFHLH